MGKRQEEPEKENSERWLLTYSDMITLLMALFIVLYAMSNIDQKKYESLSEGLQEAFNGGQFGMFDKKSGGSGVYEGVEKPVKTTAKIEDDKRVHIVQRIQDLIHGNNINVAESADGITITIYDDVNFAPGSSKLSDGGYGAIGAIIPALRDFPNKIRVSGHTDDSPVPPGAAYSSNWQLSADRALAVMGVLLDYGIPENRLSVAAYGDTQPIRGNETPEGRAYNSRVEIILLFDKQL